MVVNIGSSVNQIQGSSVAKTSWRELGVHSYIKMLIVGGLFCYLFHNEIEAIVHRWLTDDIDCLV